MNGHATGSCCHHCRLAQEDHDMLITIDEKFDAVVKTMADHEKRVRRVEQWLFIALGAGAILQLVLKG